MYKFFLITLFLIAVQTRAQQVSDTAMKVNLLTFHVAGQVPFADMQKRFGANLSAGGSFLHKTRKSWVIGLEGNYFFGRNVKEDVLSQMKNPDGFVIDNEGYPADIRVTERGLNAFLLIGRVFPKIGGNNPNCGLTINLGFGYLHHRIRLYDANQKIAAIKGDLKKGYDRLSGGFAMHQFLGYTYLSNNRLVNFVAGFEFYEAFTKSYRGFNYDTGLPDTQQRLDILIGIRFGWILPLYKRGGAGKFYYE